jgi:RNA polymerase sigma-70 factor (ECF subfamily)
MRQTIRAALDKLPPAQSEVVVLKIWENMTFVEIGEVLGESANTAASRYRYAIGKLSLPLRRIFEDALHEQ